MLFKKPKGVKYTTMAMWIDANIHNDSFDENKAFEYMYLLAYMLARKHKYFHDQNDYDGFACFLAYAVYVRMTAKDKSPIKSVLNYMKAIIYFRKVAYEHEAYEQVIDPQYNKTWDTDAYREKQIKAAQSENKEKILRSIMTYFEHIPAIVDRCIPAVYRSIAPALRKSVELTLLSRYTLTKIQEERLERGLERSSFKTEIFYQRCISNDVVLWHLDESYTDIVKVIANKVLTDLSAEIHDTISYYMISDKEFDDMNANTIMESHGDDQS